MLANARHTSSLREILSYESSPVPSSLVHKDGSVRKVIKSELASVLEKRINAPALPALTDDLIVHIVAWPLYRCINPLDPAHLRAS